MSDPKYRGPGQPAFSVSPASPNTITPPSSPATSSAVGEVTVRAIRTPAQPSPPPVQVRPVWRSEARPVSLEDLQRSEAPAAAPRAAAPTPAPVTPLNVQAVPIPVVPLASRPAPPRPAPAPFGADPEEEAASAPVPAASRSGWLNHALGDWLREEPSPPPAARPAPAPVQPAPARPVSSASPHSVHPQLASQAAPEAPPAVQVIRAEVAPGPGPASPAPRTLQEALASERLPDLPVDLLERLWEQEQAAQAPAQPAAQSAAQGTVTQAQGPVVAQTEVPALPTFQAGAHPVVPTLEPMFVGAAPFLARFLPRSAPQQMGLNARFCDLHAFLKYLHDLGWYGYLHVSMGDLSAYALVYEGRVVAAAAVNASGEQALGELLSLYEQGATMSTYPLPATYAHVLSGVGARAWKFDLTPEFTGLYADPEGALFYVRGEVAAVMAATLPYEGAFPAPQRPQTLILPRSFAGWAHVPYIATLRGRDANNPITGVYHDFRAKYGEAGAQLIRALAAGQTPAEYAARTDVPLHELEALLLEFTQGGYLKEQ